MTEWAILAAAITGAPSLATVLVALIVSRHRKWDAHEAEKRAERAMQHEHTWSMWKFRGSTVIYSHRNPNGRPIDNHHQYARRCETCGDVQIKTLNDAGKYVS